MKFKQWGNRVLCVLFLLVCCGLPAVGLFSMAAGSAEPDEENRALAPFPKVESAADLLAFPSGFEDWYTDHLFMKSSFVRWKSELEIALFHELDSEKVVLGTKKPWLFHCSNDGQPLETYKHTNRFDEEELAEIAENVDTLRAELADAGIGFVLMISPDKEQVSGGYMPSDIKVMGGKSRTEQLIGYLAEYAPEVSVVYPKDAICAAEGSFAGVDSLYYETDTHWNEAGAYIGAGELLRAVAEQAGLSYTPVETTFTKGEKTRGDLQKMVKLGAAYDSQKYVCGLDLPVTELDAVTDQNEEVIWESSEGTSEQALPVNVYITGDSFRWNLSPYVKQLTAHATISSRYYFDTEDLVMQEPQVFVYMIAERYLHELSIIPGYNTVALQMP